MALFGVNEHGRWNANLAKQFLDTHVQNIIDKYNESSEEFKKSGKDWYPRAHDEAIRIGGGDVVKGAGIIAALSPLTDWDKNIHQARELSKRGYTRNLIPQNVEKAQRILAGEHPDDVLGGHKVTNFYQNILDPSKRGPVTIDRHSYDVAMGHPFVGTGRKTTPRNGGGKMSPDLGLTKAKGRYNHFVSGYSIAADKLGIDNPNVMQSTTWVTHRGSA